MFHRFIVICIEVVASLRILITLVISTYFMWRVWNPQI